MCYSEDGRRLPRDVPDECQMMFVCERFSGSDYERLIEKRFRYLLQYTHTTAQ